MRRKTDDSGPRAPAIRDGLVAQARKMAAEGRESDRDAAVNAGGAWEGFAWELPPALRAYVALALRPLDRVRVDPDATIVVTARQPTLPAFEDDPEDW